MRQGPSLLPVCQMEMAVAWHGILRPRNLRCGPPSDTKFLGQVGKAALWWMRLARFAPTYTKACNLAAHPSKMQNAPRISPGAIRLTAGMQVFSAHCKSFLHSDPSIYAKTSCRTLVREVDRWRLMGLLALPDVVVPAHYIVWQIAMVRARRLALRHVTAAVGD